MNNKKINNGSKEVPYTKEIRSLLLSFNTWFCNCTKITFTTC